LNRLRQMRHSVVRQPLSETRTQPVTLRPFPARLFCPPPAPCWPRWLPAPSIPPACSGVPSPACQCRCNARCIPVLGSRRQWCCGPRRGSQSQQDNNSGQMITIQAKRGSPWNRATISSFGEPSGHSLYANGRKRRQKCIIGCRFSQTEWHEPRSGFAHAGR
jgi:hypothetical protein